MFLGDRRKREVRRGESLPTPPPHTPPHYLVSSPLTPIACEQTFHLGDIAKSTRAKWHARGDARAGGGGDEASRGFVVCSRVSHSRGSLRSPKWRVCSHTITPKEALIFKLKTKLICSPTSPQPPTSPRPALPRPPMTPLLCS